MTSITDAGLKELKNLAFLTELDLSATKITYAAVKPLANLKSLRTLDLSSTLMTDVGVRELKKTLPHAAIAQ
jgi:Leucine-rich repeat (LRR) protein